MATRIRERPAALNLSDGAVQRIRDHDTVATGGFVGVGFAENIALAL